MEWAEGGVVEDLDRAVAVGEDEVAGWVVCVGEGDLVRLQRLRVSTQDGWGGGCGDWKKIVVLASKGPAVRRGVCLWRVMVGKRRGAYFETGHEDSAVDAP